MFLIKFFLLFPITNSVKLTETFTSCILCSKYYTKSNSFDPQELYEIGSFSTIILLMSKLRHRKVKQLAQVTGSFFLFRFLMIRASVVRLGGGGERTTTKSIPRQCLVQK